MKKFFSLILLTILLSVTCYAQYPSAVYYVPDSTISYGRTMKSYDFIYNIQDSSLWVLTSKALATNSLATSSKYLMASKYVVPNLENVLTLGSYGGNIGITGVPSITNGGGITTGSYGFNYRGIMSYSAGFNFGSQIVDGGFGFADGLGTAISGGRGFATNAGQILNSGFGLAKDGGTLMESGTGIAIGGGVITQGGAGLALGNSYIRQGQGISGNSSTIDTSYGLAFNTSYLRGNSIGFVGNTGTISNYSYGMAFNSGLIKDYSFGVAEGSSNIINYGRGIAINGSNINNSSGIAMGGANILDGGVGFAMNGGNIAGGSVGFASGGASVTSSSNGVAMNGGTMVNGATGFVSNGGTLSNGATGFATNGGFIDYGSNGIAVNSSFIKNNSNGVAFGNSLIDTNSFGISFGNTQIYNTSYAIGFQNSIINSSNAIGLSNSQITNSQGAIATGSSTITNGNNVVGIGLSVIDSSSNVLINGHNNYVNNSSSASVISSTNSSIDNSELVASIGGNRSDIRNCDTSVFINAKERIYQNYKNSTIVGADVYLLDIPTTTESNLVYIDSNGKLSKSGVTTNTSYNVYCLLDGNQTNTGTGTFLDPYKDLNYAVSQTSPQVKAETVLVTSGNDTIKNFDNTSFFSIGMTVTGSGIPSGSIVIGIVPNTSIIISKKATSTSTTIVRFWQLKTIIVSGSGSVSSNIYKDGINFDFGDSYIYWNNFTLFQPTASMQNDFVLNGGNFTGKGNDGNFFQLYYASDESSLTIKNVKIECECASTLISTGFYRIKKAIVIGDIRSYNSSCLQVSANNIYVDGKFKALYECVSIEVYGGDGVCVIDANLESSIGYALYHNSYNNGKQVVNGNIIGSVFLDCNDIVMNGNINGSAFYFNPSSVSKCVVNGVCSFTSTIILNGSFSSVSFSSLSGSINSSCNNVTIEKYSGVIQASNGTITINGMISSQSTLGFFNVTNTIININNWFSTNESYSTSWVNSGCVINISENSYVQFAPTTTMGATINVYGGMIMYGDNGVFAITGTINIGNRGYIDLKNHAYLNLTSGKIIHNGRINQLDNFNENLQAITKSGGTYVSNNGRFVMNNTKSPIKCTANTSASRDVYYLGLTTNCNGTTYGALFSYDGSTFAPNPIILNNLNESTNFNW